MPEVIHYPERRRFQIDIDGLEAGYISYTEHNGGWDINHTEVSPNFRHRGIAKLLVSALTHSKTFISTAFLPSCPMPPSAMTKWKPSSAWQAMYHHACAV